jgi:hypothetical protein
MADDQNAPVAAGGDTAPALSVDDAVAALNQEDEKRDETPSKAAPAANEAEVQAEGGPAESPAPEAESSDDEAPATEEEAEPDAEEEAPDEIVHGNAKTRLRDGTVVAVADLKKAFDELQEVKRQSPDIKAAQAEVEKVKAEVQQQKKYLEEVLPHAIGVLERNIPAEPDASLRESDPIEYFMQKDRRDRAIAEFQQIDNARKLAQAEQQKAQQAEFQKFIEKEQTKLLDVKPELKDPAKAKEFYTKFVEIGKKRGFSEEELNNVHDHRVILGWVTDAEKAAKWDALQDAKPKVVEKAKDAIPVQQPGRRVQPAERRGAEVEELSKRLSRTGSVDDAAALLDRLNL